jgi:pyruvate,water dikinase
MKFLNRLYNLSSKDVALAWWKWASLWEMLQSGIPVPWGFVVSSTTFDYFIQQTWLLSEIETVLHSVDHKTISSVESASERIQWLILGAPIPHEIEQEIYTSFDTE